MYRKTSNWTGTWWVQISLNIKWNVVTWIYCNGTETERLSLGQLYRLLLWWGVWCWLRGQAVTVANPGIVPRWQTFRFSKRDKNNITTFTNRNNDLLVCEWFDKQNHRQFVNYQFPVEHLILTLQVVAPCIYVYGTRNLITVRLADAKPTMLGHQHAGTVIIINKSTIKFLWLPMIPYHVYGSHDGIKNAPRDLENNVSALQMLRSTAGAKVISAA